METSRSISEFAKPRDYAGLLHTSVSDRLRIKPHALFVEYFLHQAIPIPPPVIPRNQTTSSRSAGIFLFNFFPKFFMIEYDTTPDIIYLLVFCKPSFFIEKINLANDN